MPDSSNSNQEKLDALAAELRDLTESPLYDYRKENGYKPVIGEGSPTADVLFIGEAPGKQEAKSGRPFVGASGRVLDELLASIGLDRGDVYITNVVKDRPPDNRDPHADEIDLYAPLLDRQIAIIQPKVIATLGRFAMDFVLSKFDAPQQGEKISRLHGQPIKVEAPYGTVTVVPLYHPAVALYNRDQRGTLEDDFRVLKGLIEG
jgi:uracil-DNA glycosylase family 4